MKKDDVTEEGILALGRKLEAMKATGMYDEWREQLRKDTEAYEASPRGRFERFLRRIQDAWWRITGTRPWQGLRWNAGLFSIGTGGCFGLEYAQAESMDKTLRSKGADAIMQRLSWMNEDEKFVAYNKMENILSEVHEQNGITDFSIENSPVNANNEQLLLLAA